MSYKHHKDSYTQTAESRPSSRSQMPASVVPKRVNKSSPDLREDKTISSPIYLSAGMPDNNTKSIPDTATRAPDIAIRSDVTASLGNLGLM